MRVVVVLLALLIVLQAREKLKYLEKPVEGAENELVFDQKQFWFNQILDHFDYKSTAYWKQRYYVIDNYFNPKVGPVILFICGEYTCNGVPESRQWPVVMAQRWQGLILVL